MALKSTTVMSSRMHSVIPKSWKRTKIEIENITENREKTSVKHTLITKRQQQKPFRKTLTFSREVNLLSIAKAVIKKPCLNFLALNCVVKLFTVFLFLFTFLQQSFTKTLETFHIKLDVGTHRE